MRKWFVAVSMLVTAWGTLSTAQSAPPQVVPSGQALVMGRVLDDASRAPLADAAVIARVAGVVVDQVRTNREGIFVFPAIPAGEVSLGAVLPGYVGSGSAGRPVVFRAQAGQRIVDAVVSLRRFLAIGGTVRDEAGEPVVDVAVELQLRAERGQWSAIQSARTDDRGVYRFAQLNRGDYRVMVAPTMAAVPPASSRARRMVYPKTFAPATRAVQEASIISLQAVADRNGVDIALTPVGEHRVAGRLVSGEAAARSRVVLRMIMADTGGLSTPTNVATVTTDADGRFDFPSVPSGSYRLFMTQANQPRAAAPPNGAVEIATSSERLVVRNGATAPSPGAPAPLFWVNMPVNVEDKDLVDLDVPVGTGFRPTGHAVFDGTAAKPDQIQLGFIRVDVALWPMGEARITADGSLQSNELAPGRYIVFARTGTNVWQLRSADYRGVNIADLPVDVREPLTDVVFTFTDKQPSVTGAVRDSRGNALSNAAVVIFPADRRLWNVTATSWRMKIARTTQDGAFALRNVPAGEYLCAVMSDEASAQWNDVDRLAELAPRATKVVLAEGQPVRLDLQLSGGGSVDETTPGEEHGPFAPDEFMAPSVTTARPAITGVVRAQTTRREPLRGVAVELQGVNVNLRTTTYTDGAGRFVFADLAPGPYRLHFSKPAYLAAEYGAKRVGGPGTSVVVGDTDVAIEATLSRGAVISGRVTDARGRALNWTKIAVMGAREVSGPPQLFSVTSAMPKEILTDDRGEYRIYGLAPGTYFVAATPGGGGGAFSGRPTTDADIARAKDGTALITAGPVRANVEAFAPTFFPSARQFAGAQPITVAAGEERLGVDLTMGFSPVSRLRGRVLASNGRPASGAQLAVFPVGPYVPDADVVLTNNSAGEATSGGGSVRIGVGAAGTFTVAGLTPGTYTVFVRGAGTGAASEFALTTVSVADDDPPEVTVTLTPSPRVAVSLAVEGGATTELSAVRVGLTPVESGPLTVSLPPVAVAADGRVTLQGALPGRYWLSVSGLAAGVGVIDGLGAAGKLQAAPLVVPDGGDALEVALTLGRVASVAGLFSEAGGAPATDYLVVLFDADRSAWLPGTPRVQAIRPRSTGEFVFSDVPLGEYRLAAVSDIAPDEWRSPALLNQLLAASLAITVAPGQRTTQNLQIAR